MSTWGKYNAYSKGLELGLRNEFLKDQGKCTIAAIGTSIEAGVDAVGGVSENTSYLGYCMAKLVETGKFKPVDAHWNQGVGGATYASSIGNTQLTTALSYRPSILFVGGLVNDHSWSSGTTSDAAYTTELTKYKAIADAAIAVGSWPMFSGDAVEPAGAPAANVARWNRILARWCELKHYGYVELRPVLTNPRDAASTQYKHDTTHPNVLGAQRLSATLLSSFLGAPLYSPYMGMTKADYLTTSRLIGANVINGCPVNSSTGSGDTTGWSLSGTGNAMSATLTSYSGGMVNVTRNASSGDAYAQIGSSGFSTNGIVAGTDVLRVSCRHYSTVEGTGSNSTLQIQQAFTGVNYLIGWGNVIDSTDSIFETDIVPDVGATYFNFRCHNNYAGTGLSTGATGFGNIGMVNLTIIDAFLLAGGFI